MDKPLRVLIVEDTPDDAESMVLRLEEEGFNPEWQRVQTEKEYLAALEALPDLILFDWSLPQFGGLRALELMRERDLDIPFILVSGSIGEEAAIDTPRRGACDYLLKDCSKRLDQAVKQALNDKSAWEEKVRTESDLKKHLAKLEGFYTISSSLRYLEKLDDMLTILLEQTLATLDAEAGSVWLESYENDNLYMAAAKGWFSGLEKTAVQPGEGIVGAAFMMAQPYICREFIDDPNLCPSNLGKTPTGWGVCLPINIGDETTGILVVAIPPHRKINSEELKLLSSIAEIAGIAIHRIRLFEKLQASEADLTSAYNKLLAEKAEEIARLKRKSIEVQEEERTLIACDIHDIISQRAATIYYRLQTLEYGYKSNNLERTQESIAELSRLAQVMVNDITRLIFDLKPPHIDELGLEASLRRHIDQFWREYKIKIDLNVVGKLDKISFSIRLAAFRIIQEALANIRKHAQVQNASVEIKAKGNKLTGKITDKGVGFDLAKIKDQNCLGLFSMKERAQLSGGSFKINSTKGKGTCVKFTLSSAGPNKEEKGEA